jgi:flagellar motor protein MotB
MYKENLRMQRLAGLITESQYSNKLKEQEILEEGWKEVVLGAAMLLGTNLSSAQISKSEQVLQNVETLEQVKETLENKEGIHDLAEKLRMDPEELEGHMKKNAEQIEYTFDEYAKKKNLSINLNIPTGGSRKGYAGKITKGGYAVTGIETIYDTLKVNPGEPLTIKDSIAINITQDESQKTFEHKLSQKTLDDIQNLLSEIESIGGKITNIEIMSKTDAERVPSYISNSDPTGNLTLAKKRAQEAVSALNNSGVDFGDANFSVDDTSYVNGGNSPEISYEEFRNASNDESKLNDLRDKTSNERGVEIIIDWEYDSSTEMDVEPEVIVNKIVKVYLAKANVLKSGGGNYKFKGKIKVKNKKNKCRINIGKDKTLPCPLF